MVNTYTLCLKDKIEKLYIYDCMNADQAVIFFAQFNGKCDKSTPSDRR